MPLDGVQNVLRSSYTHEIAWLVLGQNPVDHLYHFVHHLRRFTYGKSADGIAVGSLVRNKLRSLLSQVFVRATLNDGEQTLVVSIERFRFSATLDAAVQPSLRQFEAVLGIAVIALSWGAFVEGHHDVGADDALGVHDVLRREEMLRPVDMRPELASLFLQFPYAGKRKHLKAAAVRQDGAVPAVEPMQSAGLSQHFKARAQIQVVGVAKYDLSFNLLAQFAEMHTLDRPTGAHGHENRRLYLTMVRCDEPCSRVACVVRML